MSTRSTDIAEDDHLMLIAIDSTRRLNRPPGAAPKGAPSLHED